jgi:hypothetical protein
MNSRLTPRCWFRRVILETAVEAGAESDQLLQGLKALGCSCEGANRRYISVNIPPDADLGVVRQYLIDHDATWEHADPTYDALFRETAL